MLNMILSGTGDVRFASAGQFIAGGASIHPRRTLPTAVLLAGAAATDWASALYILTGSDDSAIILDGTGSAPDLSSQLVYVTSGTTGYPKGVIHDFSYPLAHIVTAKYWQQAEDNGLHFTVAETGWAKAS